MQPVSLINEAETLRREWLITNGIGGFGMGTVANVPTRAYHAWLIAALHPPVGRTVLLVKMDETAELGGRACPLFDNRWNADTPLEPGGLRQLAGFRLDGTSPVWTFTFGGAALERRLWMAHGENTTYAQYTLRQSPAPIRLTLKAICHARDFHGLTRGDSRSHRAARIPGGLHLSPPDAPPWYLFAPGADATPANDWYRNYYHALENYRGLDDLGDNLHAGTFTAHLRPGESLTLAASTRPDPELDGARAWQARQAYEAGLLDTAQIADRASPLAALTLAADQFIVRRALPSPRGGEGEEMRAETGHSVIAGYPWFADWGRDTMIALPGLTLTARRPAIARSILATFARFVDRGMLPNRFPDYGEQPEYNTADATLWYFEALRAYHAATGDTALVRELFPILQDIIGWHVRGTRYQIGMDPADGLLHAGEPGVQLTWMDAKVDDWVVTPRIGKPVEINALWYNALSALAGFARLLDKPAAEYDALAQRVQASFGKFHNPTGGALFDVLDSPAGGRDPSLRPNQIFAVSLHHSPLPPAWQKRVVDVVTARLLTPHGLRSLAADDPAYVPVYGGDRYKRDGAYHQGTVWGWLIGAFVTAHFRVYADAAAARRFLQPLLAHLSDYGLGTISEIFDADPPHTPRGCPAQAWSVAEALRCLDTLGR
jgi:predicted glycogen debranching enzyme